MCVGRWDVMRAVGARERMYAGLMPLGVAIGVWNVPVLAGNLENRHVLVVWCSRQSRGKSSQVVMFWSSSVVRNAGELFRKRAVLLRFYTVRRMFL
jgi:hypothetical protein